MKNCFVICPIDEQKSDTRQRSDKVMKHIIKLVVEDLGYHVIRADEISEPGIITSQVIEHLINDDLVIADLTGGNPNVYYELAVRHLIKKPTVHIIQSGQKPFFDVSAQRTIPYDIQDLDMVEECKKKLKEQIQVVEEDPSKIDTPISQAINIRKLFQSDNPVETNMARIIEMLQEIRTRVNNITSQEEQKRTLEALLSRPIIQSYLEKAWEDAAHQKLEWTIDDKKLTENQVMINDLHRLRDRLQRNKPKDKK